MGNFLFGASEPSMDEDAVWTPAAAASPEAAWRPEGMPEAAAAAPGHPAPSCWESRLYGHVMRLDEDVEDVVSHQTLLNNRMEELTTSCCHYDRHGDEMVQQLRELTSKSLDKLNILQNQVTEVNSRISSLAGTLAFLQNQVAHLQWKTSCLGRDLYEIDS
jgi:hypothetical protein